MLNIVIQQNRTQERKIRFLIFRARGERKNSKKKELFNIGFLSFRIDLKATDYSLVANEDDFNAEMKSKSLGKCVETSIYASKKEKGEKRKRFNNEYREKQNEIAQTVFQQDSLPKGYLARRFIVFLDDFILAIAILRSNIPFDYLISGDQMRNNVEY